MLRAALTKGLRAKQGNKLICIQKARFSNSKLLKNSSTALKAPAISDDTTFGVAAATFDYEEVIDIKREYFGRTLEEYKKKVEEPLINSYISHVSSEETKIWKQEAAEVAKQKKLIKQQAREAKLKGKIIIIFLQKCIVVDIYIIYIFILTTTKNLFLERSHLLHPQ